VAAKPERLHRPDKPAPPAAGETIAAVVNKPERLSRPGKPAPPAAGETSAAAADAAERLCKIAGYKIPRRISPIRKCYLENFQALPTTLDGCITMAPETTQERVLFGILMDAGMVLSSREAKDYNRTHFKLQRKKKREGRIATKQRS
jgi:hypothetical protein